MLDIGIDLVEVRKVRRLFAERRALQESVFTAAELSDAMRQRSPFVHLAACFAVKEALFKALKTGLSGEMEWRDVEVREEKSGRLALHLSGETAKVAHSRGVVGHRLSWSHTKEYAVGMVALIANEDTRRESESRSQNGTERLPTSGF